MQTIADNGTIKHDNRTLQTLPPVCNLLLCTTTKPNSMAPNGEYVENTRLVASASLTEMCLRCTLWNSEYRIALLSHTGTDPRTVYVWFLRYANGHIENRQTDIQTRWTQYFAPRPSNNTAGPKQQTGYQLQRMNIQNNLLQYTVTGVLSVSCAHIKVISTH